MNAVFFQHPSPNCVVFHFEDNDKYSLVNNKAEGARSITHDLIKRQNVKFYTLLVPGRLNVMTPEKQRNQINSLCHTCYLSNLLDNNFKGHFIFNF